MSPTVVSQLRRASAAVLFTSSLLAGCAYGEMPQVLRSQVATESGCTDLVVKQAPSYTPGFNGNQYTVKGCGFERVYTCNGDQHGMVKFGKADCSYVAAGTPPAQPAGGEAPPPAPAGDPGDSDPGLDAPDDQNG